MCKKVVNKAIHTSGLGRSKWVEMLVWTEETFLGLWYLSKAEKESAT